MPVRGYAISLYEVRPGCLLWIIYSIGEAIHEQCHKREITDLKKGWAVSARHAHFEEQYVNSATSVTRQFQCLQMSYFVGDVLGKRQLMKLLPFFFPSLEPLWYAHSKGRDFTGYSV